MHYVILFDNLMIENIINIYGYCNVKHNSYIFFLGLVGYKLLKLQVQKDFE